MKKKDDTETQKNPSNCVNTVSTMEPLLRPQQVAAILEVSVKTVQRERERGNLRAYQIGRQWRFRAEDVEAYIDKSEVLPPIASPRASRPRAVRGSYWNQWMQELVFNSSQNRYIRASVEGVLNGIHRSPETTLARWLLERMSHGAYKESSEVIAGVVSSLLLHEELRAKSEN